MPELDQPAAQHQPAPAFATVHAIAPGADDFILVGIFTREADARDFATSINADPAYIGSAHVMPMGMAEIKALLLADAMGPLMQCVMNQTEAVATLTSCMSQLIEALSVKDGSRG